MLRIVMGGLRSMRAQELQCGGGACMRVLCMQCKYMRVHASEIRSAGAKQSGQSSRAGWNRPAAENWKDG
jgi:hypothetical protein